MQALRRPKRVSFAAWVAIVNFLLGVPVGLFLVDAAGDTPEFIIPFGAMLQAAGVFMILSAVVFAVAGIATFKQKGWGRTTLIVTYAIWIFVMVPSIFTGILLPLIILNAVAFATLMTRSASAWFRPGRGASSDV